MPSTPAAPDRRNRDEDMKPGRPPRAASEPRGSEGSSRNPKTLTDPVTGEPLPGAPAPAASNAEDRGGQKR